MQEVSGWLFLSLLASIVCVTTVSEFTPEPKDETVFLGNASHFACGTRDSSLEWKINGTFLNDMPDKRREFVENFNNQSSFGFVYSTLAIPGAAKYNGTKVQCVTGEDIESNIATMHVQGTLSAVVNLTVQVTDTSIIVSWVAPFSLNVSDREPDIWYSVFLKNKTGQTQISCSNCTNISETNYNFTLDQCHEYTITIVPVNGAGEGEKNHIPFANVPNSSSICNNSEEPTVPRNEGETDEKEDSSLIIGPVVGGVVAFVLLVAVVGLVTWCGYNRNNKKAKKTICQEVGHEDYSSVDTHQGSPQIELEMGENKPVTEEEAVGDDNHVDGHQIEVEVAENNDGKEATAKEEIPGNDNSKPADEKGEMCPVKEPREVEEQGEGRAEHKTEEEEQGMLVAPKMEGELTEKKDENKEIAKEGPFVDPETERVDNSQVTDSDTAQPQDDTHPVSQVTDSDTAQPQDDTHPERVVWFTSSGQCIPRNSSSSNNLASSPEKLASVSAPQVTISEIQEQSDKVVTSDKGSEESSEFVVRETVRNKRTTQSLRDSLTTQEPISDAATMSNPYQPSPQPADNDEDCIYYPVKCQ